MQPSTYLNSATAAAIKTYILETLTADGLIRSFLLRPQSWDGQNHHVFIVFTPAGMVLQGPLVCGPDGRGVLSDRSYDWFVAEHTSEELLAEFFQMTWQVDVAERDLRFLARNAHADQAATLIALADRLHTIGDMDQNMLSKALMEMGFDRDGARDVGYDYPLEDAMWVSAIHQHVSQLLRYPN